MYSREERMTSNCTGSRGKKQLDPARLHKIKEVTFKIWPLDSKENPDDAWKDCKRAIDEGGRQLNMKQRLQPDAVNYVTDYLTQ